MSLLTDGFQNEPVYDFKLQQYVQIPKQEKSTSPPSSKEQYEARRRDRRRYVCSNCGFTFQGSGSWRQAEEHEREWKHTIIQGDRQVTWQSRGFMTS